MEYVPMKGRWATFLFVAIIAVGASILSVSVGGNLSGHRMSAPIVTEDSSKIINTDSDEMVVVNADGSKFDHKSQLRESEEVSDEMDSDLEATGVENTDNSSVENADDNMRAPETSNPNNSGVRIE